MDPRGIGFQAIDERICTIGRQAAGKKIRRTSLGIDRSSGLLGRCSKQSRLGYGLGPFLTRSPPKFQFNSIHHHTQDYILSTTT